MTRVFPFPVLALGLLLVLPMATPTGDPVTILVNYGGLIGAFALLVLGGSRGLHTSGEIRALQAQIDAQTRTIHDQGEVIKAKDSLMAAFLQAFTSPNGAIPMIQRVGDVLGAIPEQESALMKLLRESTAQTAELKATLEKRDQGGFT